MSGPPTVRIGVIGVGALGFHHARLLRAVDGATLAGVYDTDAARLASVAAELGVHAFPSLDALLAAVDSATIVVPTPAHFDVARQALDRGLHVLIEKPIAESLEQADELLAVASRRDALIQTGHVERFNQAIRAAKPFIDRPRFIECNRLAPFNTRGSDVAVVLDLMIHDIDLIRTLVGSTVESVSAVGVPVLTGSVDIANARLTFASGAVANITASRVSRERMRKLRVFQPTGYLTLDLATGTGELYRIRPDLDREAFLKAAHGGGAQEIERFVERVPLEAPDGEPLRLELESFVRAVQGAGAVEVTGQDGREALAMALHIVRDIERSWPRLAGAPAPIRA